MGKRYVGLEVGAMFEHERLGACVIRKIHADGTVSVATTDVIGNHNTFRLSPPVALGLHRYIYDIELGV